MTLQAGSGSGRICKVASVYFNVWGSQVGGAIVTKTVQEGLCHTPPRTYCPDKHLLISFNTFLLCSWTSPQAEFPTCRCFSRLSVAVCESFCLSPFILIEVYPGFVCSMSVIPELERLLKIFNLSFPIFIVTCCLYLVINRLY